VTTKTGITTGLFLTLLAALVCACEGSTFPLRGNVSAGIGQKWRTEPSFPQTLPPRTRSAFEPIVNVIAGLRSLPVVLEVYGSRTRQNGHPDTANDVILQETRIESGIGLAGIARIGPIYSHLGAGIARISSKTKSLYTESPEGTFSETGHWIGGGAFVPLGRGFDIGGVLRYTNVDRHLDPTYGYELGGVSASALIGWGWLGSR